MGNTLKYLTNLINPNKFKKVETKKQRTDEINRNQAPRWQEQTKHPN